MRRTLKPAAAACGSYDSGQDSRWLCLGSSNVLRGPSPSRRRSLVVEVIALWTQWGVGVRQRRHRPTHLAQRCGTGTRCWREECQSKEMDVGETAPPNGRRGPLAHLCWWAVSKRGHRWAAFVSDFAVSRRGKLCQRSAPCLCFGDFATGLANRHVRGWLQHAGGLANPCLGS